MSAKPATVLSIGAGAALAVLALFGAVAFAAVSRLSNEQEAIAGVNQSIAAIDQVFAASAEAERAGSEFVMTGAPAALQAFDTAQSHVEESLDILRASAEDRPSERAVLDTLGPMIGDRFAMLKAAIATRRRDGARAATALARSDTMRSTRGGILPLLNRVRNEELVMLAERTRLMSRNGQISKVVILAGSILAFLLAAIAFTPVRAAQTANGK